MSRQSWRPEATAPETGPEWRRVASAKPRADIGIGPNRRGLKGIVLFSFLILSGLLIWIATWLLPRKPACLVLVGAGYEDNLAIPPNVYGRASLKDLAILAGSAGPDGGRKRALLRLKQGPTELRTGTAWDQDLDSFSEKTLILVLALHGGSDPQGAYLLPQNADPTDAKQRLRLTQVLDRLEQLPAKKNKVLVLDATQVTADWPLGMLHNDFARELEKLGPRIVSIPNLVVLSASGPDQRSWVSPEWRRTIFAHYLIEGLRGAADRNDNGRVDAWELSEYVRNGVSRWVWANRRALQTPVLLPLGDEGEKRARAIDLSRVESSYQSPDPGTTTAFEAPPELVQAWERHHQLASQSPAPTAYTMHLWHQYEAALVRYEELLAAGDSESAASLANKLRELERTVRQAQGLELASGQNTLAMPAAAGMGALVPERVNLSADELWDTTEPDKVWARLQQTGPTDYWGRRVLRLKLCGLLIERAARDPVQNLEKAYSLLKLLSDPLGPAPAEVHFLVMARRDLPRPMSRELAGPLQLALRVRLLAERAALAVGDGGQAYSEQIVPWLRTRLDPADQSRRPGEDLLFTEAENWAESRRLLLEAEDAYRKAQAMAEVIRSALALRDRVEGALPGYAQWLARRRPAEDAQAQQGDAAQMRRLEKLADGVRSLGQQLETPFPATRDKAAATPLDLVQLGAQVEGLRSDFSDLQKRFQDQLAPLLEATEPGSMQDIGAALRVTDLEPNLRAQLLVQRRRLSRRLLIETARQTDAGTPVTAARNAELVRDQGRREGHMALAVLGARTFDQFQGADRENFQQVANRLERFTTEEQWWLSLGRAGEEIGYRCDQLPAEVRRLVDAARLQDNNQGRAALRDAARMDRQVEGAFEVPGTVRAEDLYRRSLVQDLLLYQAARTLDDHWFAEDPGAEPYCETAGLRYVEDSRRLVPGKQLALLDTLDRQLKDPGRLTFQGPTRLAWTSELQQSVQYTLGSSPNTLLPPGFAVVQIEAGASMVLDSPAARRRLMQAVKAGQTSGPIACLLRSPFLQEAEAKPPRLPRPETTRLALLGLYRGQRITLDTIVELYPLAETIVDQQPLPARGSVAVRASRGVQERYGNGSGTIAIVLDCSGSMGPPAGQEFSSATKFAQATGALQDVLKHLPRGTTLSLWVFGQAIDTAKTVEEAEQTIKRIQEPIVWNPDDPILLEGLMKKVSYPALEPWNESPIIRTMLEAKQDLRSATGFKTLVVITDGMDNRFEKDPVLKSRKKELREVLREEFQDSGIVVNVVGFKVESKEEEEARKQFQVVEKFTLPGKYVEVTEVSALAGVLEKALRQRLRYFIDGADNLPISGQSETGQEVSSGSANDRWLVNGLEPSQYRLRVHTDRRLLKNFVLRGGDLLLANVVSTPDGLRIERSLLSRDDFPDKPWREQTGRRMAVLQNQWLPADRAVQMLATLEVAPDVREDPLQQIKPGVVWFEVRPVSDAGLVYAQRWGFRYGYPAPVWGIDVPEWPTRTGSGVPLKPIVQAWWGPDLDTVSSVTLRQGPDYRVLRDLVGRTFQVAGLEVVCESVEIEDHLVEVRPGVRERTPCQVIRLRCPAGQEVWVRIDSPGVVGQEHRLYKAAGKYALLLWPADRSQGEQVPVSVSLVSVAAFKREAALRKQTVDIPLEEPQTGDTRPRSPLPELK